ncbi:MAG TPA: type II secretion system F family protein, partial [Epulopiscium sp.]|nr:type II secretion system F family protein [Candidatus Epulonipiscium sp.]
MEIYLYKARKIGTNTIVKSEGQFESVAHVNKHLIDNQLVPLSVTKKTALTADLSELPLFRPRVKVQDIVFFCKQFGVMLGAGISIGGALAILGEQAPNPTLRKKIKEIDKDVQKGSNLSEAMAKHPEFPDLLISMLKSAEASGIMDQVMEKMAIHYEKQMNLNRTLKKALTYPALVLITIAIVIPVLMIFVVPGFVDIFQDSGIQLPLATRVVIAISEWTQANWYLLILGGIGLVIGIVLFKKSKKGKMFFDKMALSMPLIGNLNKKTITAIFAETLSLLVTSGVPVFQSLEIVSGVLQNAVATEEMEGNLKSVREGATISSSLESSKIYPP